jgi:hypothetical protein
MESIRKEGVVELPSWIHQDSGDSSEEERMEEAEHGVPGTEGEAPRPEVCSGCVVAGEVVQRGQLLEHVEQVGTRLMKHSFLMSNLLCRAWMSKSGR